MTRTAACSRSGSIRSDDTWRGRHLLEPDRLPDAGDGRVVDALRLQHLLAARLLAGVRRIADRDDQLLLAGAGLQRVGDVDGERVVAALVLATCLPLTKTDGLPVHRAEMEQQRWPVGERRQGEGAPIPQPLFGRDANAGAAQLRFDREGHQDRGRRMTQGARRLPP